MNINEPCVKWYFPRCLKEGEWELNNQIKKLQFRAKILLDFIQKGKPSDTKGRKEWDNKSFELQVLEEEIEQLYGERDSFLDLL